MALAGTINPGNRARVYTASINPASVGIGDLSEVTMTVTGVTATDRLIAAIPPAASGLLVSGAYVSAADTVKVQLSNPFNPRVYDVTFDPASVGAATTAGQDVTVTGVLTTDVLISVEPPVLAVALGVAGARVKAADTITVYLVNATAAPLDAASQTWRFTVGSAAAVDAAAGTWTFIVSDAE